MRRPSGESNPPDATQNAIQSTANAISPDEARLAPAADAAAPDTTTDHGASTASDTATPLERPGVVENADVTDSARADGVQETDDALYRLADDRTPAPIATQGVTESAESAESATTDTPDTPRRRSSRPARSTADEAERVARSGTFILTMTLVSALLVSGLLLTLSSVTRLNAGPTQPSVQRQVTPTPTTTVFPTPTAEPGFQLYVDRSDGFLIQYPSGWALVSLSPGIDFKDDPNSPGYIVQVLFPGAFSAPSGQPGNPNSGSFWVNYALNGLSTTLSQQGMGVLSRQANCPAPYNQSITIGGVVWQCGAGYDLVGVTPTPTVAPGATPSATPTVTPQPTVGAGQTQTPGVAPAGGCPNGSCLQVVVLATVYHGKPYIISLLTSSDRFEAGEIEFFEPMLNSFAFLPQA